MALRSFKMPSAYRSWVSIATAYRYLPEVVDVIADQATDLPKPTRGTSLVSSGNRDGSLQSTRKRPAGTVPCGSFGGSLTKSVHAITEKFNPSDDET
jgi:hypothetical protein